jgi:hypothetical protein
MELAVKLKTSDLRYRVFFKEPLFDLLKPEVRIPFIHKILKLFDLRLNDIKVKEDTPSNDHIHFSRFYGASFFNVSFGLEEVEGFLGTARDEAQVVDLYGKFFQLFEQAPISIQRMTIQRHLSTNGDAILFLESLNPNPPSVFKEFLQGTGVHYTLKISEHELTIYITLVESLFVQKGLFLSIDYEFSPNLHDFQNAFKIVKEYHDFILKGLGLQIIMED